MKAVAEGPATPPAGGTSESSYHLQAAPLHRVGFHPGHCERIIDTLKQLTLEQQKAENPSKSHFAQAISAKAVLP